MKKRLFSVLVALIVGAGVQAQTSGFGLKAGYTLITAKAEFEGISASAGESGFFIGVTGELGIVRFFSIQPELLYARAAEVGFIYLPVMAKLYISPEFSLQAGPQISMVMDASPEENDFGLDAGFGAGFKIDNNWFLDARYALELTNRLSEDFGYNLKGSYNTLMIGLGYKF